MLIVMNKDEMYLVSGSGEVIEPDEGILAIGSGGNFALASAKALKKHASQLSAREIAETSINVAGDIDIFTNHHVISESF